MAKWYANGTQNNAYIEWEKPYIQQKRQSFGCLFLFCFAIFIEIPVDYFNRQLRNKFAIQIENAVGILQSRILLESA